MDEYLQEWYDANPLSEIPLELFNYSEFLDEPIEPITKPALKIQLFDNKRKMLTSFKIIDMQVSEL